MSNRAVGVFLLAAGCSGGDETRIAAVLPLSA